MGPTPRGRRSSGLAFGFWKVRPSTSITVPALDEAVDGLDQVVQLNVDFGHGAVMGDQPLLVFPPSGLMALEPLLVPLSRRIVFWTMRCSGPPATAGGPAVGPPGGDGAPP